MKVAISGDGDIGPIAHYPTVAGHADAAVVAPNQPPELSCLAFFRFLDDSPLPCEAPRAR